MDPQSRRLHLLGKPHVRALSTQQILLAQLATEKHVREQNEREGRRILRECIENEKPDWEEIQPADPGEQTTQEEEWLRLEELHITLENRAVEEQLHGIEQLWNETEKSFREEERRMDELRVKEEAKCAEEDRVAQEMKQEAQRVEDEEWRKRHEARMVEHLQISEEKWKGKAEYVAREASYDIKADRTLNGAAKGDYKEGRAGGSRADGREEEKLWMEEWRRVEEVWIMEQQRKTQVENQAEQVRIQLEVKPEEQIQKQDEEEGRRGKQIQIEEANQYSLDMDNRPNHQPKELIREARPVSEAPYSQLSERPTESALSQDGGKVQIAGPSAGEASGDRAKMLEYLHWQGMVERPEGTGTIWKVEGGYRPQMRLKQQKIT